MDKDFMPEGHKSTMKQEEHESFTEAKETLEETPQEDHVDNDPLVEVMDELNKTKEQLLRVTADFTNFKKRSLKERQDAHISSLVGTLRPFLQVIDDFERALKTPVNDENAQFQTWIQGFEMIHKNLIKQLEVLGVVEITTNEGFNPLYHEALMLVEKEGAEPGSIVEVLRKGYLYHDTVIRCSQVSVAK